MLQFIDKDIFQDNFDCSYYLLNVLTLEFQARLRYSSVPHHRGRRWNRMKLQDRGSGVERVYVHRLVLCVILNNPYPQIIGKKLLNFCKMFRILLSILSA